MVLDACLPCDFERTCGRSLALRESAGRDGSLIVRGANPNQTLTYFDGVEIPSVINGEFLDRINFFLGGFGSRYGCAVGGGVEVGSRKGAAYAWHGVAKVDLLDVETARRSRDGEGEVERGSSNSKGGSPNLSNRHHRV